MISGSGAAAAVSVLEDRFKPDMEVRKQSCHWLTIAIEAIGVTTSFFGPTYVLHIGEVIQVL